MSDLIFNFFRTIIAFFVILTLLKNYIFLIIAPLYPVREKWRHIRMGLRHRRRYPGKPFEPKISILVPAWNEAVGIIKTMQSILYNGYDNIELIVINDGSTDDSDAIIKAYIKDLRKKDIAAADLIRYFYKQNGGKGKALNYGIRRAKGEIILTIDADSALKKGAISNLSKYYLDDSIMAVVGNVEVNNSKTVIGFAQKMEYYFGFYNKRAHALLGAEYIFGGACASFRRSVFKTIGLFDDKNKTEDIEMSMRTKFFGLKSTYAENVICYTEGASDLTGLIAQRVRWKKGRLDTFAKYRTLFFSTEEHHNFFLAFFVLPFSLLTEFQLIFEPIAIAILIIYSIITSEYLSLAIGILFILLVYVSVSLFHNTRPRPHLILLFPFTWPLFYVLDWIEFIALYKSIKIIRQGKDVEWQRWNRQGIKVAVAKD